MPSMLRLALALFVTLSLTAASCTDEAADPHHGIIKASISESDLDVLFKRLRETRDASEAEMIEVAILHAWAESGQADVDALMLEGLKALHDTEVEVAEAMFDEVVRMAPQFAEGWNMRATVRWLKDDYRAAIEDIRHVLVLEPRHFAALNLLGRIFSELGREQLALRVFEKALEINPHLEDAQEQMEGLREQVAGLPI
jgi:tetratricopeptide (TPR) repeat protein